MKSVLIWAGVAVLAALAVPQLGLCAAAIGLFVYGMRAAVDRPAFALPTILAVTGLLMVAASIPAHAGEHPGKAPATVLLDRSMPSLALPALATAQPIAVHVDAVAAPAPAVEASVAVPVNEWAVAARNTLITILLAVWAFAKNKLPAPIVWAVMAYGERKLIEQAVDFGINSVAGATRGEPLKVEVGNQVLAIAVQWAVENVPALIVKMMGGEAGIQQKIFASLHLDKDADADALNVAPLGL